MNALVFVTRLCQGNCLSFKDTGGVLMKKQLALGAVHCQTAQIFSQVLWILAIVILPKYVQASVICEVEKTIGNALFGHVGKTSGGERQEEEIRKKKPLNPHLIRLEIQKYQYFQSEIGKKKQQLERHIKSFQTRISMWSDRIQWYQQEVENLKTGHNLKDYYRQLDFIGKRKIIRNYQQGIEDLKALIQGAMFQLYSVRNEWAIYCGDFDMYALLIQRLRHFLEDCEGCDICFLMTPKL